MVGTNDFLPYAIGVGSNVDSQASWASNPAQNVGFSSGILKSSTANKLWRQAMFVSSCIAQFMAEFSGNNIFDDGNIAEFVANFQLALGGLSPQMLVYAGNPNGFVAGTQATGGRPPTLCWDTSDNVLWACVLTGPAISAQWAPVIPGASSALFGSAGVTDWTVPPGVFSVLALLVGGGGSGGGSSGSTVGATGGGAGGWAIKQCAVTPGQIIPVTVGAGGVAPGGNANGNAGGTTSFGTYFSATGGGGGDRLGLAGGASGVGVSGDLSSPGGGGFSIPVGLGYGANGGGSYFGTGGIGSATVGGQGSPLGCGGAGGYNNNAGGAGQIGVAYVTWN